MAGVTGSDALAVAGPDSSKPAAARAVQSAAVAKQNAQWNRSCPGGVGANMYALLFLALTFAPILAPCMVLGTAVALAVRVRRRQPVLVRHLPSVTTCALIAVLVSAAAYGAYSWGVMSGFYILDPDQMCASKGVAGDHVVTRWTLPVSARCVTPGSAPTSLPAVKHSLTLLAHAYTRPASRGTSKRSAIPGAPYSEPLVSTRLPW